jgi:beta-lactamase regulating signal transducer with metallopeptidase domain
MSTADGLAAAWWTRASDGLVEGCAALAVVLALWWALRRRLPPRFVCILFLLPLVKVASPVGLPAPAWWSPLAVFGTATQAPMLAAPPLPLAVAAIEAAPAAAPAFDLRDLLFGVWLLGVAALSWRRARAQARARAAVRAAAPVDAARFPVDLASLCARAGVARRVRWLTSDRVVTPAAGGVLAPYVLLPRGFAASLPPAQLAFVLLHELAHVRRHDVAVALAQRLVQILWFFHPAVWLASWIIDQQRELACDQDALERSRATRRECGEAFLSVAAWVNGRRPQPTTALAMFGSQRVLRRRLMQILTRSPAESRVLTAVSLVLAGALTLPSAKADDGLAFDAPAFEQQDDGQREELQQLRRQLAELRRELAALKRESAPAADDDPVKVKKAKRGGESVDVVGVGPGGAVAAPRRFRADGTRARAYVVQGDDGDGEVVARVLDADDLADLQGKVVVQAEGKDGVVAHVVELDDVDDLKQPVVIESRDGDGRVVARVLKGGKAITVDGKAVRLRVRGDGDDDEDEDEGEDEGEDEDDGARKRTYVRTLGEVDGEPRLLRVPGLTTVEGTRAKVLAPDTNLLSPGRALRLGSGKMLLLPSDGEAKAKAKVKAGGKAKDAEPKRGRAIV